jgi:hypothetical protein
MVKTVHQVDIRGWATMTGSLSYPKHRSYLLLPAPTSASVNNRKDLVLGVHDMFLNLLART